MYRDIHGAKRLGIKTIFFDSNQGDKYYENVSPDYIAHRFDEVINGLKALT
jgi:putative hydrolase of the HAD superfamily